MNSQFKATVILLVQKESIFGYWSFIELEHNTVAAKPWFCLVSTEGANYNCSLLDTDTWAVLSQGIQDDIGAKSTNWLAGWLTIIRSMGFGRVLFQ